MQLRKIIPEYLINVILVVIISFSALDGFRFNYPQYQLIIFNALLVLFFMFILKRPQIIIFLLILILAADIIIFYYYKDLMLKLIFYIDGFIKWINIYMNYHETPNGFYILTEKYMIFTIILTFVLISFIITMSNFIFKNDILTLFLGIIFFTVQWYNYVDNAYMYLGYYIAASFINIGLKNFYKKRNTKKSVFLFIIISIFLILVNTMAAEIMPKNFDTITWGKLDNWFYNTFTFTQNWRNSIRSAKNLPYDTKFTSFTTKLGGSIEPSKQIIFEVKSNESAYLRGMVYDKYDGNSWDNTIQKYIFANKDEPLVNISALKVKVKINELKIKPINIKSDIIFSPMMPYKLSIDAFYDESGYILKAKNSTDYDNYYTVKYLIPGVDLNDLKTKSHTQLPQETRKKYLEYPVDLPERIKTLTNEITKNEKNQYDKVKAVENYLRKFPYSYQVKPVPPGRDFVDYFLFDLKKGYCTYYATSMVVMLRTVGIPARYVVGFKMPSSPLNGDVYTVSSEDAHAWVEVFFDDYGWLKFEPTAEYPAVEYGTSMINGDEIIFNASEELANADIEISKGKKTNVFQSETVNKNDNKVDKINNYYKIKVLSLLLILISIIVFYIIIKNRNIRLKSNKDIIVFYYKKIIKFLSKKGIKKLDTETPLEYSIKVENIGIPDFKKIADIYNNIVYGDIEPDKENVIYVKEYLKNLKKNFKKRI
ncbi:MAG: transglutaminase-like domain-containing protein [Thermoanaerobacteraceae bacterium]